MRTNRVNRLSAGSTRSADLNAQWGRDVTVTLEALLRSISFNKTLPTRKLVVQEFSFWMARGGDRPDAHKQYSDGDHTTQHNGRLDITARLHALSSAQSTAASSSALHTSSNLS